MKKYIAIITLIFYACGSNKSNNSTTIPYIFPNKVTSLISDYLIKNEDISFLYLSRSNNDWVVTFIKCTECENDNNWVKNTNRKVYVNRKFYPIVFDSDQNILLKEYSGKALFFAFDNIEIMVDTFQNILRTVKKDFVHIQTIYAGISGIDGGEDLATFKNETNKIVINYFCAKL
jgi:hypothetical protein